MFLGWPLQFLQDEASKLKTQLEAAERQLQEYRERNDAVVFGKE